MTWASALLIIGAVGWLGSRDATRDGPRLWARLARSRLVPAALVGAILIDPAGYLTTHVTAGPMSNERLARAVDVTGSAEDAGGAAEAMMRQAGGVEPFRYVGYVSPDGLYFQAHELFAAPWAQALLINNRALLLDLHDAQGYDPAQLVSYLEAFTVLNGAERDYHEALVYPSGLGSPILDLLNVRFVLVTNVDAIRIEQTELDGLPATYTEVWRNDMVRLLENTSALPRAWIVHDVVQTDAANALALVENRAIDPRTTALVREPAAPLAPPPAGAVDSVVVTRYAADEATISVEAASDGMLVLADVYDAGWTVYVDGVQSELYRTYDLLRGVVVPAGVHDVVFRYELTSLRVGVWVSMAGYAALTAIIGLSLVGRRRRHRSTRHLTPSAKR